ncbi:sigma-54 interaction domain-containing protein [Cytobacillus sp. IB215665]|uniref:sigma-54 interaction domain-containing protein n=1 Tax=Cytobacillus sp. IB215665 TaxID=3097357 RepID=UPI002A103D15|nr:sigma 54-interacting transcriptional regulator [Cytobacillus sp. IB215665]MDX8366819.1 sigma 54-interacting transcriptional regulator [Cytobacillus sp. IB215665]
MSYISKIEEFAQSCADNMADLLGLEVSIIDELGIRVSGTGFHQSLIGKSIPEGSFFEQILRTGSKGTIFDNRKDHEHCMSCIFHERCTELATMGYPVMMNDQPIGVIGFIGFTAEQRDLILTNKEKLYKFMGTISTLLENKLLLLEVTTKNCEVHEGFQQEKRAYSFDDMIGESEQFHSVVKKAKKVVNSPSTILLSGENGTGKECMAKAVHYESNRANQPFITVNCSAIPETLVESELFGYDKGAFTGANREGKIGKFEAANNGTIFLDEIGDLPLSVQPKLLRVLQEKEVERVGGTRQYSLNVRVIAATNKSLWEMVTKGTFREDLYYRINVIPLRLPSLSERVGDIRLFLSYFLKKYSQILQKNVPQLDPLLEQWFLQNEWPGNIRQLENTVEYMMNMVESPHTLTFEDLPYYLHTRQNSSSLDSMVANFERNILAQHLPLNQKEQKEQLAKMLNISLSTLYRKLEKYGLS